MTEALFVVEANPEAPRCRMCPRPARWIATAGEWGMYCAGRSCSNRERLCQSCGRLFEMGHSGAGTKYCSETCKARGYGAGKASRSTKYAPCAWCGEVPAAPHSRAQGLWPWICPTCIEPIRHVVGRLKQHRVPHVKARKLLAEPGCDVCGKDLLALVPDGSTGKLRAALVVDHDHRCCPQAHSCGACVRGFLCGTCNSAAGLLRDDPDIANRMAAYLANASERVA